MPILSIIFGGIVGLSLGLTGGGGAIFAVPLLAYGMGLPAREAVMISLVSVGMTSFVGFLGKWKKGEAEIRTGLLFALAGMTGAPLGTWIAAQIPEALLMFLFSVLMLVIAVRMWLQGSQTKPTAVNCVPADRCEPLSSPTVDGGPSCQRDATGNLILTSRCARLLLLIGIASGVLSGMFGVGGGFIIVPALIVFSGMSMLRAVGTSLMVISLVSVSGIVSQVVAGQSLNLQTTAFFVVGGLAGLWAGQSISHRLSASMLQRVFAISILLVAVFVVIRNSV
ncbi:MAG: sulfite exporter TauE/SafE family protein [Planctomyces sp.]|nr:sulfite exporter TauE/SafE family protein [Planctomyces sp.]